MTGAALLGKVGDHIQHQGNIGAVAQKAPLLLHRQQTGIEHRLEVKREGIGGNIELAGQFTGDPPLQPGLHQQPPYIEPDAGCQRFKDLGGHLFVHLHSPWCDLFHFNYTRIIEMIKIRTEAKIRGAGIKLGRLENRQVNNSSGRPHRVHRR